MDEIRIRELPQKGSSISLSDLIIIEDEDGTKTIESSAFKSLIQQSMFFDTVEDMKNATLREGDIIKTLGYRAVNDGGGAYYIIEYAPTDVEDGIYIHYLHTSDTLRAHYIRSENDINISQAGAYGDGVNDDFSVIQKMLNQGTMVAVPRRTYKVTGSLDVLSGTTIDLNGATILCENCAAFSIGLDHFASNITIKNGKFMGINGIELYTYASEITIQNCEFYGSSKVAMSKGILINGASNVQISNCKIGSKNENEVRYGIYLSNGTGEDNDSHINYNIHMNDLSIMTSMAGVSFSGTFVDKNIALTDFSMEGYYSDRTAQEMYGILIGSNADSISISNGQFKNFNTGLVVTGIITAVISCTDIMMDDCDVMYNFASAGSTIHLYGIHRFTGNKSLDASIFDRITSKVIFHGDFDADRDLSNIASLYKTSLVGEMFDNVSPIGRKKISVASLSALTNSELTNSIPGYRNVSLNLEFSGKISKFGFPSLSGQIIALYSDASNCILTPSSTIKIPENITLSKYEPVILRNYAGIWTMVQFGGSIENTGSSGGSSGSGGVTIDTLEPLNIYLGTELSCQYDGTNTRTVEITPTAIGAAKTKHNHTASEISGIPTVPTSLKNPCTLVISVNGGTIEGQNMFTYDGSKQVTVDITGGGNGDSVDLSAYARKENFTGSGYFSVNRKDATEAGLYSVAMGYNATSSGIASVAIGNIVSATAASAVAFGYDNLASADSAVVLNAENVASGRFALATGNETIAKGQSSFTTGAGTLAYSNNQFVFGRYNVADSEGTYVNIIGAGSGNSNRKNIYTLDWDGNSYFAGTVTADDPTADNHLTTKHYVDQINSNLSSQISTNSSSISSLRMIINNLEVGAGGSSYTGTGLITTGINQFVTGKYNIEDINETYVNIVGSGSSDADRINIYTLDWDGNAVYTGTVSAATPTSNSNLTTKKYVDDADSALNKKIAANSQSIDDLEEAVSSLSGGTGVGLIITGNQHVIGRYNVEDSTTKYATIVGAGYADDDRANIYTLDWDGNGVYSGNVSAENPTEDEHLATKLYVDEADIALNEQITQNIASIALLTSAVNTLSDNKNQVTIENWNDVDVNGFVCGTGAQNAPPSCTNGTIVGLSMLQFKPIQSQVEGEEDDVNYTPFNGLVIAFNVNNTFEYRTDGLMALPVYMRQLQNGSWGDWYKIYIGHGDFDA